MNNIYVITSIAYDNVKNKIVCKCARGYFNHFETARDTVLDYRETISEGGYFQYVLIERKALNQLDARDSLKDWYQYTKTPGDNILVEKIDTPEALKGLF